MNLLGYYIDFLTTDAWTGCHAQLPVMRNKDFTLSAYRVALKAGFLSLLGTGAALSKLFLG